MTTNNDRFASFVLVVCGGIPPTSDQSLDSENLTRSNATNTADDEQEDVMALVFFLCFCLRSAGYLIGCHSVPHDSSQSAYSALLGVLPPPHRRIYLIMNSEPVWGGFDRLRRRSGRVKLLLTH